MKHSDPKINGIYKIKEDCIGVCQNANDRKGTHIKITSFDRSNDGSSAFEYIILRGGERVWSCWGCLRPEHLELCEESPKPEAWTQDPAKFRKGEDWYTQETVFIDGQEMSIEDFKAKAKRYKSLESSYNRNFSN